ncbi:hypothetical protein ACQJBY_024222 [Aegilops geniculata]
MAVSNPTCFFSLPISSKAVSSLPLPLPRVLSPDLHLYRRPYLRLTADALDRPPFRPPPPSPYPSLRVASLLSPPRPRFWALGGFQ